MFLVTAQARERVLRENLEMKPGWLQLPTSSMAKSRERKDNKSDSDQHHIEHSIPTLYEDGSNHATHPKNYPSTANTDIFSRITITDNPCMADSSNMGYGGQFSHLTV
ncbi:uncharacterized protein [Aquarana catesbeiana]|uniref:uncharacterized protein isoform X2 n=1 Tax=Aquarana catesbeiana TaxID=8400 RepID=UPI003CCA1A7B